MEENQVENGFLESNLDDYSNQQLLRNTKLFKVVVIVFIIGLLVTLASAITQISITSDSDEIKKHIYSFLFSLVFGGLPILFVWLYQKKMRNGLTVSSDEEINNGLKMLRNYFIITGIYLIIIILAAIFLYIYIKSKLPF